MNITISNSEDDYELTADPRFTFREGTDFGMTQRIAEEIVNPLAPADTQKSDDWGKLREITLAMTVRGEDMDDLMTNVDWLQEQFHLDEAWWLIVKPADGMPDSYFRILKSPLFAVPFNLMSQARFRVNLEVKLNAEPYCYGAMQTVCESQSLTNPGVYEIDEALGDFDAPLKVHMHSNGGGESTWIGMSEFDFAPLVISNPGTLAHGGLDVSGGNLIGTMSYSEVRDHFPPWGYVRFGPSTFPRTGTYRVLVRLRDSGRTRFKLFVTDWDHAGPNTRPVRPSTYREFRVQGDRIGDYIWYDAGEYRSGGNRNCDLWAAIWSTHTIDKVVFLPTDMGMLGLYQYNHVWNSSKNERPSDMSWNTFTYERPLLTIDSLDTTAACCGTGLMLPAGSGTQYIATCMNPDGRTPDITIHYRPRYAGWARE